MTEPQIDAVTAYEAAVVAAGRKERMENTIDRGEYEILDHTIKRAANHSYCGSDNDPWMKRLVEKGFMRRLGRPSWLPEGDAYFTVTPEGREAHRIGVTAQ